MRWIEAKPSKDVVAGLQGRGLSRHVAILLANRGIDAGSADAFLNPRLSLMSSPWLLQDMEKAASLVADAIQYGAKIAIHGDKDCDGVTSTALLTSFMREAGAEVIPYMPSREDGYGVKEKGLDLAFSSAADLVVTADCGITAIEPAKICRQRGVKFVVTDHHLPGESLPDADAVVNPHRADCAFPFKGLAGVGVAFYLLAAVRKHLRDAGHRGGSIELRSYLDLVCLGSIADVAPLLSDNRLLVSAGIEIMASEPRLGLGYLMEVAGLTAVSSQDIAFRLGPRINAAGRLASPDLAFRLLMAQDPGEAAALADELNKLNEQRQAIQEDVMAEVEEQIVKTYALDRRALVLAGDWHQGVIGIVAGKIAEKYNRPTFLFSVSDGLAKGSGRSIPGFHLREALDVCSMFLDSYGGHEQAAGASLPVNFIDEFREAFCRYAEARLPEDEEMDSELAIDMEIDGKDINLDFVKGFSALEPFGEGNPEPVFAVKNAELIDCKVMKEKHTAFTLRHGGRQFRAIGFNMAPPRSGTKMLDFAIRLSENEWNGRTQVNVLISDVRASRSGES